MENSVSKKTNYMDWNKFSGADIPSSLSTYPILYEKISYGQRIADIGCGYGKTCFELLSNGYGPIFGFDINNNGIDFALDKLKNIPEEFHTAVKEVLGKELDPDLLM